MENKTIEYLYNYWLEIADNEDPKTMVIVFPSIGNYDHIISKLNSKIRSNMSTDRLLENFETFNKRGIKDNKGNRIIYKIDCAGATCSVGNVNRIVFYNPKEFKNLKSSYMAWLPLLLFSSEVNGIQDGELVDMSELIKSSQTEVEMLSDIAPLKESVGSMAYCDASLYETSKLVGSGSYNVSHEIHLPISLQLADSQPNINTIKKIVKIAFESKGVEASPRDIYDAAWDAYYKINNMPQRNIDDVDCYLSEELKKTRVKYGGAYWISPSGMIFNCDERITLDLAFYTEYIKEKDSFYNKKKIPYFLEQQGYMRLQNDALSFMKEPTMPQFNTLGKMITEIRKNNLMKTLYIETDGIVSFKKRYQDPYLDQIIKDITEAYE